MSAITAAIALVDELYKALQRPNTSLNHESSCMSSSTANGVSSQSRAGAATGPNQASPVAAPSEASAPSDQAAPAQNKKGKKPKPQPAPEKPLTPSDLFGKACLKVARVLSVSTVDGSDKLYKTQLDVGGGETRQVIAGLKKHVEVSRLEGSLVVIITNLKTAKLAGEVSEGMILAAVHLDDSLPGGEIVTPITPPASAEAGDRIYLENDTPSESPPKLLKSGPWGEIKAKLKVAGGGGCYDSIPLVTAAGPLSAGHLPDGASIS